MIPVGLRLMGDQLTPVLAYRRLVVRDERTAPSFLFESVEGGERVGRYSIMGSRPLIEVIARQSDVTIRDRRRNSTPHARYAHDDPLGLLRELSKSMHPAMPEGESARNLPTATMGGWIGFAAYDTVRYAEAAKLPFDSAPRDDRGLPDLHFGFYNRVVIFDHVETLVHVVELVEVAAGADAGACYDRAAAELTRAAAELQTHSKPLPSGFFQAERASPRSLESNLTRQDHARMVRTAKDYIKSGDIFQVVLGQRFERRSLADPFDVYRALRAVNPSPYMGYLQSEGCFLVASSPEILCRVRRGTPAESTAPGNAPMIVTNRPLAGTRPRGRTPQEDAALERELLADAKERAEHIMLVDLGRNDVGQVARPGSIRTPSLLTVERYSHVMHISSTVEGELAAGKDCWDALRAALPVGTISGAPKVRAMQIIDELEPVRRGPYGGGFGYVSLTGEMDIALTLRTIVVPTAQRNEAGWMYHLQAAGGIVYDSDPDAEYQETVNKAAALARAIEVAERAFSTDQQGPSPA
ncbi:MAG: anthranilate synthase component I [Phycisphaerae bacterium]|nr:anthranilate synthase component I [Phycisphaerae bacterium]